MIKIKKAKLILFSIIIMSIIIAFFLRLLPKLIIYVSTLIGFPLDTDNLPTNYWIGIVIRLLGSFAIVFIMYRLNLLKNIKLKWDKKYILISWLFFIYIAFNIQFVSIGLDKIPLLILMIISCIVVGLFEELLLRGLVLGLLLKAWRKNKKEIYFATIFSSVLFGAVHILNYLAGKAELVETLCQVGYATFIGVLFAAIYLRCNFSIWWCVLLHALFNAASGLSEVASYSNITKTPSAVNSNYKDQIINMLMMIPIIVYGLFILRKVNLEKESTDINTTYY